ncbi:hypothetical protein YWIDRAFT_06338 [Streptomyces sp. SceaMP-e96]|nr:hypothetical protein YWIDRAFT_06338 [Streptomyces sp. SceaMP-e96]
MWARSCVAGRHGTRRCYSTGASEVGRPGISSKVERYSGRSSTTRCPASGITPSSAPSVVRTAGPSRRGGRTASCSPVTTRRGIDRAGRVAAPGGPLEREAAVARQGDGGTEGVAHHRYRLGRELLDHLAQPRPVPGQPAAGKTTSAGTESGLARDVHQQDLVAGGDQIRGRRQGHGGVEVGARDEHNGRCAGAGENHVGRCALGGHRLAFVRHRPCAELAEAPASDELSARRTAVDRVHSSSIAPRPGPRHEKGSKGLGKL